MSPQEPGRPQVVVVGPDGIAVGGSDDADANPSERPITDMVEQPAKVMRIGSMIRQLLEEVKSAPLDEKSRARLKEIHQNSIKELEDGLAPDGRIANIGMQQGRRAELDFGALMAKRASVSSTSLRARPAEQKASIVAAVAQHVWPLVGAGLIRPVIDIELPMEQAAQAHRIMTESTHTGKIVLRAK